MKEVFAPKAIPKPRKALPKLCRPCGTPDDGAVYVVINRKHKGRWSYTRELVKDLVFADFDKEDRLLGVEVVR